MNAPSLRWLLLLAGLPLLALPAGGLAQGQPEPTPLLGEPTIMTPVLPAPDSADPVDPPASATTTAATEPGPDRCERNDTPARACPLALDAVNGPFTFLPAGDQDWYRLELPAAGLATTITVRGTAGLDLITTLSRDDGTALGTIASPAISTTLAPDIAGGVLVRVENRDPGAGARDQYNFEIRRTLPPAPALPPAEGGASLPPDALENNWSPANAAPIGVGVVYDLNFICPVAWGCAGGDHDYLRLPVKAGVRYLIATFDLGPGVDTVLDLFWGDEVHPLGANDDARAGASFLSVLRWVAPADGEAILRVGPRTGGLSPIVNDEDAGTYRLAIALAASDLAQQMEDRIADQTNAPTPTARPVTAGRAAGGAAAAAPAQPATAPAVISTDAPTGTARVSGAETALREGPSAAAPAIQPLPAEAVVTLLGQSSGGWVRVQPADGVVPGWVRGADLERQVETAPTDTVVPTPKIPLNAPGLTPTPASQALVIEPLAPLPVRAVPAPAPRVAITLTVQVARANEPRRTTPGSPALTPDPANLTPLAGVRIHLVTALGDVLAEAVTPATGTVALTTEVPSGAALAVVLPALGLEVPLDPAQPTLQVVIPSYEENAHA